MLRYDIINFLIKEYGYKRYLEIGVEDGHSIYQVNCETVHGVDPASTHATFKLESDEFFNMIKPEIKYDIIFVDGLHVEEQVDRDIQNALNHLLPDGVIVVHDCNPPSEWHQRSYEEALKNGCRQWNGTVWRSIVKLRANRQDLQIRVVNTDWGCGLIRPILNIDDYVQPISIQEPLTYKFLSENRQEALNLITPQQFLDHYKFS